MFADMEFWKTGLWAAGAIVVGVAGGLIARRLLFAALGRVVKGTTGGTDDILIASLRRPAALIFPLFGIQLALTAAPIDGPLKNFLRQALALAMIAAVGWVVVSLIGGGGRMFAHRYGRGDHSEHAKRDMETRIHLLSRLATTIVAVVAAGIMLMTIPAVRQLGTSILASAGIAGVVAGLAAQSLIANLLAGVQLALTEPVRIGDSVVIEKELGTIEQIGSTFVVVRLWDLRRLIVPLTYFFQNHYENWTFRSSDMLGTTLIYVDYRAPVGRLREELQRIVEQSPKWDRKIAVLQVTEATDRAVQLRALVSADSPDNLWDLRCEVREKLLEFLQKTSPDCLPRMRAEWAGPPAGSPPELPMDPRPEQEPSRVHPQPR